MRTLHANGTSLLFVCIYLHAGRNLYYGSYNFIHTWSVGVVILFLTTATAFVGYVLPWGQISFWGATVITNLLSAIPYVGKEVVQWVWGGFAVDNATLTRFFALNFLIPFVIAAIVSSHWCINGIKSVQVVTVTSKTEAEWQTKERYIILCLCMAAMMCVCSFCVCSVSTQENITGILSKANFRSLARPIADVARSNRFCASALTFIDHLLEETGLTQELWH